MKEIGIVNASLSKIHIRSNYRNTTIIMKGTKVQTLGARAVAGAWCMAGRLIAI